MKRKFFAIIIISLIAVQISAQWAPQGDKLKTKWAETLDPNNVLPEYPRPLMERNEWQNLNGLWQYAILPVGQSEPQQYQGQILVPFAVESSLSGVQKEVGDKNELWYKTNFTIPPKWKGKDVILHFGAVDWKAEVYLNDIKIGMHTGGYTPFSFNISPFLNKSQQKLVVKVWDGTDAGYQPRGKQVSKPEGIWYTPVTGIWQTVWLEPVAPKHITYIKATPDIDKQVLTVEVDTENTENYDIIEVQVFDNKTLVANAKAAKGQTLALNIPNVKLWSPESPFLYDMQVKLYSQGKVTDEVKSYTAMRKI